MNEKKTAVVISETAITVVKSYDKPDKPDKPGKPPEPDEADWQSLKLGAGGQLTWIDIAEDGTMLSMPDIHGLYVWDTTLPNTGNDHATRPTGRWRQAVNAASIPNAAELPNQPPGDDFSSGIQVYAARMAPDNSSRMYMYMGNGYDGPGGYGYFYTSTDKGLSWTHCPAAPNFGANSQGSTKFLSPSMAVDPHNEQIVFLGLTSHGLWRTSDAGVTWTQIPISQVALPTAAVGGVGGGHIVCFDANDPQIVYASSYGVGVYRSTDGGINWSLLDSAGMPVLPGKLLVDKVGVLWVIAALSNPEMVSIGKVLKYQDGVWTDCSLSIPSSPNDLRSIAVEPTTAPDRRIVVTQKDTAMVMLSTDEGATWGAASYSPVKIAEDIPWLTTTGEWEVAHIVAAADGNIWMAMGIGVFFAPLDSIPLINTPVTWTSRSVGNEMLVAQWIISPPGGDAIVAVMDRGVMKSPQTTYPAALTAGAMINHGRGCDYASNDPTFIVLADGGGNVVANAQYSTDGGAKWSQFTNQPGGGSIITGGCIASASPENHVTFLNYGGGLWYTKDNGATPWLRCGGLDPAGGWISFSADHRRCNVIADRVNIGTFYAYCDGQNITAQPMGFYKSTDGGANWTLYAEGLYHEGFTTFPGNPDTYAYEMQMRAVPGVAGNFYCSTGRNALAKQMPFYEMQDTGSTLTRTRVVGVDSVRSHGIGKAKQGNTYPSIYICGNVADGGFGVWRSDDHAVTWTKLGTTAYPNDNLDAAWVICGDMNVYDKCYVGFYGSGAATWSAPS